MRRRKFLRSAAILTAGASMPCDHDPVAVADLNAGPSTVHPTAQAVKSLPQVSLGSHRISRLIVGGNPLYGYSHFSQLFSQHMTEWATPERVCQVLRQCEDAGINTWQISQVDRALNDLKRHRAEGGRLQWILLSHREMEEDHRLVGELAKLKPIGIVHHGGSAERKRRAGQLGKVKDFLKSVRDSGVMVGLSLHDPSMMELVEEQQWDIDFYMTALYYLTRSPEEFQKILGQKPIGEVYLPEDPPRMFQVIRHTRKTCLCYKVLAAGRLCDSPEQIEQAFQATFNNIKPQDAMIVGMYPRFHDQVRENTERVIRICAAMPS